MIARLTIAQAGPLTSIQDPGRPGWRRFGVSPSGPVDRIACAAANLALGNPAGAAAIEISHGGLTLMCTEGEVALALAGGAEAAIDGVDVGGWTTAVLAQGRRMRVRASRASNWGYVALAGAVVAPEWLGSRATHLLAGLGGGRLGAGQGITIEQARADRATQAIIPPPDRTPLAVARVVLGPQERFFSPDVLDALTERQFVVTSRFDRMGVVLDGAALRPIRIDMPSEPTVRGALQVDGEGRVTMLGADHQTTGGYPRIATVIACDADRVAQLPAGAALRFVAISPDEAITVARASRARDAGYLEAVAGSARPRPSLLDVNLIDGAVDALRSVGDAEVHQ